MEQCGTRQRCWSHKTMTALHAQSSASAQLTSSVSPHQKTKTIIQTHKRPTQCNIRFHLYEAPDVVKLRDGSRRVPGRAGCWGGELETVMVMGAGPHTCTDGWKGKTACPVSLPTVPEVTADHPRRGRTQLTSVRGHCPSFSRPERLLSTNRMDCAFVFSPGQGQIK